MWKILFVGIEMTLIISVVLVEGQPSLHQQRGREGSVLDCSDPTGTYYREAIPSIDAPTYETVPEADNYLDRGDRIVGFFIDGTWYGFPIRILNRHEIVNDLELGLSITYCPLTGSALVYPLNQLDGSTLGVTGYLFESNLVFYDRHSDSCFVQMLSLSLSGERLGQRLTYIPTVDLFWDDWMALFPDSMILSRNSGFDPAYYAEDQYRSYSKDNSILYPANFLDDEPYNLYHPKTRTMVIELGNKTFLFPSEEFSTDMVVQFSQGNEDYVVFHDNSSGLLQAFKANGKFTPFRNEKGLYFLDEEGKGYDVLGKGIINHEDKLDVIPTFVSYWYAAIVFFPNSKIFTDTDFLNYDVAVGNPYVVIPAQKASNRFFIFGILVLTISFMVTLRWMWKRQKGE